MSKFEKKFGKYAIQNLTLVLIICYIMGYIIELTSPQLLYFLTLNPEKILHGQVWRIFSWLLVPPSGFDLFTLLMLYFYYSIGTVMERTLGTYRYNVYLIGGMLMTVLASFLCLGAIVLFPNLLGGEAAQRYQFFLNLQGKEEAMKYLAACVQSYSLMFSTYYINISIFLAFAACYPDMEVLLMFIVPVKVKWMGILDLILLLYTMVAGDIFTKFAVGAALLNFLIFYLSTKNLGYLKPSQIKRRSQFKHQVHQSSKITRHKCAICGQTEETSPNLEFRFCSKCNGNYEYCETHLYTHEHVK